MRTPCHPSPDPLSGPAQSELHRPALVRHLAFAAGEMAHEPGLPPAEAARYAGAEARLRGLAGAGPQAVARPPVVPLSDGRDLSLIDLLDAAWSRHQWHVPLRGIDPEMVEAARQLLRDLSWRLPQGDAGRA